MEKNEKIKIWFFLIFRILLLLAGIIAIWSHNWTNLILSVLTLFLTFLPAIVERQLQFIFPNEFELAILVFIYASLYLGEIHSFYERFWWWDILLHGFSSVIIGGIGFVLVYVLNEQRAIKLSPAFVAIFALSFSLAIGSIWEIFEYLMDAMFSLNMQKTGLSDTMWDLIVDTLGALIVSVLGYVHIKKDVKFLEKLALRLTKSNVS